ncbi:MAG TPA: PepSY domain-containing protein [Xanthobacteraceae bacterium]|nr:PepSY domain-containing protein [Xanthobacteraceae bacterium]
MRTTVAAAALLMSLFALPASAPAQTVGVAPDRITVDEARDVAGMNGVVDIRKIELYDGAWHVDGRDMTGRHVEMTIDPHSGTIAHLERYD